MHYPLQVGVQTIIMLFIFAKRQVMRFALRSRRGPHVSVGQVRCMNGHLYTLFCSLLSTYFHPCFLKEKFPCIMLIRLLSMQGSMKQLRREIDRRLDYVNYVTHEPQVS